MQIVNHTFEEYLHIIKTFHGSEAPGVIIGGFMVDMAIRHIPDGTLYDAICETRSCLPDAIQLLTPCTTGNGWLKVIHSGRFALTLYDKYTNEGVRVFIDTKKLEKWPEIKAWLFKLETSNGKKPDITEEIAKAGESILSIQRIHVKPEIGKKISKGKIGVCPQCGEAYPINDGRVCLGCQDSPYI
jgi:formylmethanofuran dehydrogenase subunit E